MTQITIKNPKQRSIIVKKLDDLSEQLSKHDKDMKARHQRGETNAGIAETVFSQLSQDYDKRLLGWVKAAEWSGPEDVPLNEVDTSNRNSWAAMDDLPHVQDFIKQVKDGSVKPIILVNEPNNNKMMIADGHHRFLAAQEANLPVRAYIATVGGVNGDWVNMHDKEKDHGVEMSNQKETKPNVS